MKIGIVGLGLIGGSLLKSLSNKGYDVYCVTRNLDTINKAQIYTKNVADDFSLLSSCNVVFVCTPISKTVETLRTLENFLSENTIVTDVASVKTFVMQNKYKFKFIGSHPMAGLETSGFDASVEDLFKNAKWVLTPYQNSSNEDICELKNIIEQTGAEIILSTPEEHDKAVAYISHLPMFVAQALVKNIDSSSLAHQLAASGFRDTTRLAMTNTTLAQDMLVFNKENIVESFNGLYENIKSLLEDKDYKDIAEAISMKRANMYDSKGKNTYKKMKF